jgi:ArsR family transcriptional regulator
MVPVPFDRAIDPAGVASASRQLLSRDSERAAQGLLNALCDGTRLNIVRALRGKNQLAASDIARVIKRSRAATSQHLRVLREVGAVVATRTGNFVRYRLSDQVSAEILDDIAASFDRLDEAAG